MPRKLQESLGGGAGNRTGRGKNDGSATPEELEFIKRKRAAMRAGRGRRVFNTPSFNVGADVEVAGRAGPAMFDRTTKGGDPFQSKPNPRPFRADPRAGAEPKEKPFSFDDDDEVVMEEPEIEEEDPDVDNIFTNPREWTEGIGFAKDKQDYTQWGPFGVDGTFAAHNRLLVDDTFFGTSLAGTARSARLSMEKVIFEEALPKLKELGRVTDGQIAEFKSAWVALTSVTYSMYATWDDRDDAVNYNVQMKRMMEKLETLAMDIGGIPKDHPLVNKNVRTDYATAQLANFSAGGSFFEPKVDAMFDLKESYSRTATPEDEAKWASEIDRLEKAAKDQADRSAAAYKPAFAQPDKSAFLGGKGWNSDIFPNKYYFREKKETPVERETPAQKKKKKPRVSVPGFNVGEKEDVDRPICVDDLCDAIVEEIGSELPKDLLDIEAKRKRKGGKGKGKEKGKAPLVEGAAVASEGEWRNTESTPALRKQAAKFKERAKAELFFGHIMTGIRHYMVEDYKDAALDKRDEEDRKLERRNAAREIDQETRSSEGPMEFSIGANGRRSDSEGSSTDEDEPHDDNVKIPRGKPHDDNVGITQKGLPGREEQKAQEKHEINIYRAWLQRALFGATGVDVGGYKADIGHLRRWYNHVIDFLEGENISGWKKVLRTVLVAYFAPICYTQFYNQFQTFVDEKEPHYAETTKWMEWADDTQNTMAAHLAVVDEKTNNVMKGLYTKLDRIEAATQHLTRSMYNVGGAEIIERVRVSDSPLGALEELRKSFLLVDKANAWSTLSNIKGAAVAKEEAVNALVKQFEKHSIFLPGVSDRTIRDKLSDRMKENQSALVWMMQTLLLFGSKKVNDKWTVKNLGAKSTLDRVSKLGGYTPKDIGAAIYLAWAEGKAGFETPSEIVLPSTRRLGSQKLDMRKILEVKELLKIYSSQLDNLLHDTVGMNMARVGPMGESMLKTLQGADIHGARVGLGQLGKYQILNTKARTAVQMASGFQGKLLQNFNSKIDIPTKLAMILNGTLGIPTGLAYPMAYLLYFRVCVPTWTVNAISWIAKKSSEMARKDSEWTVIGWAQASVSSVLSAFVGPNVSYVAGGIRDTFGFLTDPETWWGYPACMLGDIAMTIFGNMILEYMFIFDPMAAPKWASRKVAEWVNGVSKIFMVGNRYFGGGVVMDNEKRLALSDKELEAWYLAWKEEDVFTDMTEAHFKRLVEEGDTDDETFIRQKAYECALKDIVEEYAWRRHDNVLSALIHVVGSTIHALGPRTLYFTGFTIPLLLSNLLTFVGSALSGIMINIATTLGIPGAMTSLGVTPAMTVVLNSSIATAIANGVTWVGGAIFATEGLSVASTFLYLSGWYNFIVFGTVLVIGGTSIIRAAGSAARVALRAAFNVLAPPLLAALYYSAKRILTMDYAPFPKKMGRTMVAMIPGRGWLAGWKEAKEAKEAKDGKRTLQEKGSRGLFTLKDEIYKRKSLISYSLAIASIVGTVYWTGTTGTLWNYLMGNKEGGTKSLSTLTRMDAQDMSLKDRLDYIESMSSLTDGDKEELLENLGVFTSTLEQVAAEAGADKLSFEVTPDQFDLGAMDEDHKGGIAKLVTKLLGYEAAGSLETRLTDLVEPYDAIKLLSTERGIPVNDLLGVVMDLDEVTEVWDQVHEYILLVNDQLSPMLD